MHAAPPANGPGRHASGASPDRPRSLWRVYLFELVAVLSLAAVTAFSVLAPVGLHYSLLARLTFRRMALIAVVSVACILATKLLGGVRRGASLRRSIADSELSMPRFWLDLLRIMVAFSIVQTAHLTFKVYTPVITSLNYDAVLARWDRALLFGHDPNALLLHVVSSPTLLRAFDLFYSGAYFFLLWGGVVLFFTLLEGDARIAFFSSYVVMWQLGLLFYLLVPSWGPVFVTPQLFEEALQHMPATVWVQSHLYEETASIIRGSYNIVIQFFGLAAFPSLHVAVFVLYSLWARQIGRIWVWIGVSIAALILLGSLLTGYHYLVDGLAGALVSAFAYVVGRRYAVIWRAGPASPRSPAPEADRPGADG